ncbi:ATP-dependent DNA helicase RecG [Anaerolineales bacterium HSG6]|nr:ATP-dependent DNA helicase RecG [Anaerolineales bacterium HSG6]
MLQSFDKLTKMLTQEKRLGYKNKAVMGGFDKYAVNWITEAMGETTAGPLQDAIKEIEQKLINYPNIVEEERPTYVHKILVQLYKLSESQKPSPRPANASPSSQVKPTSTDSSSWPQKPPQPTKAKRVPVRSLPPKPVKPDTKPDKSKAEVKTQPKSKPQSKPPASSAQTTRQPKPTAYVPERSDDFNGMGLDSPVTRLPGIKTVTAKKLTNLNIETVGDFLQLHPRRYDDYRSLKTLNRLKYGEEVTVIGHVWETRKRELSRNRTMTIAVISDGTATIEVTWFNQPWLLNKLRQGMQIVVSGKVNEYLGRLNFQSPDWEELDKNLIHTGRIVPIYPLTSGITAKWLRNQIKRTLDYWGPRLTDSLPEDTVTRLKMLSINEAVRHLHFPDDWANLEAARRRLAFDELLLIQLAVLRQRQLWKAELGQPVKIETGVVDKFLGALPFTLTNSQRKVINEIMADLQLNTPMNRLLQGDVGAGKTVVALAAMVFAALDGGQTAILAPTEILAEQHHVGMKGLLEQIGNKLGRSFNIEILTGSTKAKERQELAKRLESGEIDILVGTHAIIQKGVKFKSLRLAVVDEQHRFGVEQRANLRRKGDNPHLLVMTATPIPRTLALTIYGDLDVSVIDELPPGRQVIETRWLAPRERERSYSFIRSQMDKGRQAFVICPLVEDSDKLEAKSAVEEHKRLQKQIFPRLKLGLLHGRMKPKEKDAVMRSFRDKEIDILVSTSVVEVGIDVPNATVMLVEGANRFGLSQLHQFRGRVGRGEYKSYCLLVTDKLSAEAEQRLQAIERTSNGFELAEEDLKLRGPGEFFGTRQSGLPDMKFVKLSDTRLIELARKEAQAILQEDPNIETDKYQELQKKLENFWTERSDYNQ